MINEIKDSSIVSSQLYVPYTDHQKQIAELEAENKRLRDAAQKTLGYWRRNSPTNLQYDKLGDYIRLLAEALSPAATQDAERG